jgi:S-adenosylmethionine decarboxylase
MKSTIFFYLFALGITSSTQTKTLTLYTNKIRPLAIAKDEKKPVGIHLIAEFWNTTKNLSDEKTLEKSLITAAHKADALPLKVLTQKFEPNGLTGIVLLAESHISVHTWPELNYVAIDVFTCGHRCTPIKAIEHLKEIFAPQKTQITTLPRGIKANAVDTVVEKSLAKLKEQQQETTKEEVKNTDFGKELILDLYDCDHETICSGSKIKEFSVKLCDLIEMKRFGKPFLQRFAEHSKIAAGYSLAQMIETSLISGHFSESLNRAYINIFSCKTFDTQQATIFTKEFFGAKSVKQRIIIR